MKKRNIISVLLTLVMVSIMISGCEKYEEGGLVSKTEKNLKSSWKLDKYFRNSTDETSLLLISGYQETYADGGKYSRSYTESDGNLVAETGTWSFDKGEKQLNISGVSSVEVTEAAGTVSSSYYNILKLEDGVFWYSFTNGGDTHEFRLIQQ